MSASQASWLLLIGFILWNFSSRRVFTGEIYEVVQDPRKLKKEIRSIRIAQILAWFCLIINLLVVWQGFHLLQTGYSPIEIDPELAAKTSYRARGRGGIIILIIRYFPYFLIFGYGVFALNSIFYIFSVYPNRYRELKEKSTEYELMSTKERVKINKNIIKKQKAEKEKELKQKRYLESIENSRKEAIKQELKWLTKEGFEGWLINPDDGKCKRFFLKNTNNKSFIVEERGTIVKGKPPLMGKSVYLTPKEAQSDWVYYLNTGYIPTTKKW